MYSWMFCHENKTWKKIETDSSLYPFYQLFSRWIWVSQYQKSPFWILLELRVMEVVVTTGAIIRAELQSNRHHQQTNTQFFTGRMPFLTPNHHCQSTEGKKIKTDSYTKEIYRMCQMFPANFDALPLRQRWINFQDFFTVKFTKDLQRKMLLKSPPPLTSAGTLPGEM